MSDKIRKSIINCDFTQSFQIMIDKYRTSSRLACSVLERIGDEYKRTRKLSISAIITKC